MDAQAGANTPGWLHRTATQLEQASTDVLEKKMTDFDNPDYYFPDVWEPPFIGPITKSLAEFLEWESAFFEREHSA